MRHLQIHSKAKEFRCEICQKIFSRKGSLIRHSVIHNNDKNTTFECLKCGKVFGRKDNLITHQATHLRTFPCCQCDQIFASKQNLTQHMKSIHPKQKIGVQSSTPKRQKVETISDVFTTRYIVPSEVAAWDLLVFLRELNDSLSTMLQGELEMKRAIKWYIVTKVRFSRINPDGEEEYVTPYFRSLMEVELDTFMINQHIGEAFSKIMLAFDEFIERGSGWTLDKILHMEVKMIMYHPLAPY